MTRYLISFGADAMDHIPDEDMPAVGKAAHAVVQEAVNAGVFVCGGGLEDQQASIVATDGMVTDGPYPEVIGGFTVVEVPSREEALAWAAKIAVACRCAQEVREFCPTPNKTRCSARQTGDGDVNLPRLKSQGSAAFRNGAGHIQTRAARISPEIVKRYLKPNRACSTQQCELRMVGGGPARSLSLLMRLQARRCVWIWKGGAGTMPY